MTFGWTGDAMDDGRRIPPLHDGMAAFAGENGRVVLVRNHEINIGPALSEAAYDAQAGGGTTTTVFDPVAERVVRTRVSLAGTLRNCAGGSTPWGSWLTCEESVAGPTDQRGAVPLQHGYVFEVPHDGTSDAKPIKGMGCFVHEAVAVDPQTGIVYQTQDRAQAGVYRYVPTVRGKLAQGGKLQMLAVDGRSGFDTTRGQRSGVAYDIHWVDIQEPDKPHISAATGGGSGVFQQGLDRGGAIFSRLEGAVFGDGRIYVTATDGGNAKMGQVWEIDPRRDRMRLLFESPGSPVLNMPDNLALSPRGGLVLCEDGGGEEGVNRRDADPSQIQRLAARFAMPRGAWHSTC